MNSSTYRMSANVELSVMTLTAGASSPRLGRPQAQAARIAVGREVRRVHGEVGELLVYDAFEKVGVRRRAPPRVHSAGVEISRCLPVGREVAQEPRLQQRAAPAVLAPPPSHVVRTAHLDSQDAGPVGYQELV